MCAGSIVDSRALIDCDSPHSVLAPSYLFGLRPEKVDQPGLEDTEWLPVGQDT
jgi:hypothetical protein